MSDSSNVSIVSNGKQKVSTKKPSLDSGSGQGQSRGSSRSNTSEKSKSSDTVSSSGPGNVTVFPAVTRSRSLKLLTSTSKRRNNSRWFESKKKSLTAVSGSSGSGSSSSSSEHLSPVLGKGLSRRGKGKAKGQNQSNRKSTSSEKSNSECSKRISTASESESEPDTVYSEKETSKRRRPKSKDVKLKKRVAASKSKPLIAAATRTTEVEVEVNEELFLLDSENPLFHLQPIYTPSRTSVRRRCLSIKGNSPLLPNSIDINQDTNVVGGPNTDNFSSGIEDFESQNFDGSKYEHVEVEGVGDCNESNIELDTSDLPNSYSQKTSTPLRSRTSVGSRLNVQQQQQEGKQACSSTSPKQIKRRRPDSLAVGSSSSPSPHNSSASANSASAKSSSPSNLSSPMQLNSTPSRGSSVSPSLKSPQSVSPSKWTLCMKPGFKIQRKIAKHFSYIGHRDEEITTSGSFENRYAVSCKRCPAVLAGHTSSYGNLRRHLLMRHGIRRPYTLLQPENNGTYDKSHPKQLRYEMNCLRYTLLNNLPFQMARYDAFQVLVEDLEPCIKTISGKTLSRRFEVCSKRAAAENNMFLEKIPYISIFVDGRTTKRNKGVIAVQAMYVTDEFKWGIRTIGLQELSRRHTGTAIRDCVNDILREYNLLDEVASVIIDNGSNMVSAFDNFKNRAPFSHRPPPRPMGSSHNAHRCVAHTLQLVVKNAKLGPVAVSVKKAMLGITRIMSSHILRKILLVQTGRGFPKKSETRWNAEYDIICLLVTGKMFNAVNSIINYALTTTEGVFFQNAETKPERMSNTDYSHLKLYCSLLEPLATATDRLQADGFTAHLILPGLLRCYQKIQPIALENPDNIGPSNLVAEFCHRFASWFSDPVLVTATVLDPWRKLHFFDYMRTFSYDNELPLMTNADILTVVKEYAVKCSETSYGINKPPKSKDSPDSVSNAAEAETNKAASCSGESLDEYTTINTSLDITPNVSVNSLNNEDNSIPCTITSENVLGASPTPTSPSRPDEDENPFASIIDLEIKAFVSLNIALVDVDEFWKEHQVQFKMLATLFKCIMSRSSSTAPLERLFSKCGIISRDKRTNVLPTSLKKLLITREWFEGEDELRPKQVRAERVNANATNETENDNAAAAAACDDEFEFGLNEEEDGVFDISGCQSPSQAQASASQRPQRKSQVRPSSSLSLSSSSSSGSGRSPSQSLLSEEYIDFETALKLVLDDKDNLNCEDDGDVGSWECFVSQEQGWDC